MPFKNTNALVRRADPVAAAEPRTAAGRELFADWLERRRDHPPNTKRALDLILRIEAEARSLSDSEPPPGLRQRLGEYLWRTLGNVTPGQAHEMAGDFLARQPQPALPSEPPDPDEVRRNLFEQLGPWIKHHRPCLDGCECGLDDALDRYRAGRAESERERAGDPLDANPWCPCGHDDSEHVHYCAHGMGDCECNAEYARLSSQSPVASEESPT